MILIGEHVCLPHLHCQRAANHHCLPPPASCRRATTCGLKKREKAEGWMLIRIKKGILGCHGDVMIYDMYIYIHVYICIYGLHKHVCMYINIYLQNLTYDYICFPPSLEGLDWRKTRDHSSFLPAWTISNIQKKQAPGAMKHSGSPRNQFFQHTH